MIEEERCDDPDEERLLGEWEFGATPIIRYVVSEGYPWGVQWYVWREERNADGSWPCDMQHQCGPAFRSLEKACTYAEKLATKERKQAALRDAAGEAVEAKKPRPYIG